MKEEKECQVTCKMYTGGKTNRTHSCKIIKEGGVEQMKLETQSKKLEDMTAEELEKKKLQKPITVSLRNVVSMLLIC